MERGEGISGQRVGSKGGEVQSLLSRCGARGRGESCGAGLKEAEGFRCGWGEGEGVIEG